MNDTVLSGYAESSTEIIGRFEMISPDQLYQHVIDLFPLQRSRIVDIGAGTGRDAAWLAAKGHDVTAVEPVEELRQAGVNLHQDASIDWLDDRLPILRSLQDRAPFQMVLLTGVWQHLRDDERSLAMGNLARITAESGKVIISLRHGPGADNRPVFPVSAEDTIETAAREGLKVIRRHHSGSVQASNRASGVTWTWLVLEKT